jgi:hypothetical protein
MLQNNFPVEKTGFFFSDRNRKEFNEKTTAYVKNLCLETERWREETKLLQSHLNVKCRHCDTTNKLTFHCIGPGNTHTYGGNNGNTYIEREYLLKPEYGKKLKPDKKYYWRYMSSLEGHCLNCKN